MNSTDYDRAKELPWELVGIEAICGVPILRVVRSEITEAVEYLVAETGEEVFVGRWSDYRIGDEKRAMAIKRMERRLRDKSSTEKTS